MQLKRYRYRPFLGPILYHRLDEVYSYNSCNNNYGKGSACETFSVSAFINCCIHTNRNRMTNS